MASASAVVGVTEVICFKDFFNRWVCEIQKKEMVSVTTGESYGTMRCKEYASADFKLSFEEFASEYMSPEVVAELDAECSPATLDCELESPDMVTDIPEHVDLTCVQHQKAEVERRIADPIYRSRTMDKMKYRLREGPWKHHILRAGNTSSDKSSDDLNNLKPSYPDILITVQIYRPYKKRKLLTLMQEFDVLGQQRLTELRDVISCASDHMIVGDFSENPDLPCDFAAKDIYKSGCFFIEGVLYDDMRDPSNRDYSRQIIEWSKDPSRGVGPFSSRRMEMTHFIDLNARLGQPYCYIHQGDCEHIVIFTDLRLLHPEDCQQIKKYPLAVYRIRERKPFCRVCQMYLAKWITHGSQLAPEDPCFFCETCFRALHYDSDGKKLVADMKVYPILGMKPGVM